LWGLPQDPINFPVRERKRFIFLLILESVSIRLMLASDCFSPDTQRAERATRKVSTHSADEQQILCHTGAYENALATEILLKHKNAIDISR
jgi:hypothetical protein